MRTGLPDIGYGFERQELLVQALTHPSWALEHQAADNQRLEYLGDAVLQLCVSQQLYARFPKEGEGKLSRRRAALVREETLAEAARRMGLGKALRISVGEEHTGGRDKPSILADAMEAVLAAVYLDGGMAPAGQLVERIIGGNWNVMVISLDAKTALQEKLQARGQPTPVYALMGQEGPAHAPVFTCRVSCGDQVLAQGQGSSKKQAEQQAAKAALSAL